MSLSTRPGSLHLRCSLKRGLARQALAAARNSQARHAATFAQFSELAPNRRALERAVRRLRKLPGVVQAGLSEGRLVITLRNACTLLTRANGLDAFQEEGLIYTRIVVAVRKNGMLAWINRANFSLHVLERFVERSDYALDGGFPQTVDGEAVVMLRKLTQGDILEHADDSYVRACFDGIRAGSMDTTAPDPEWGIFATDGMVPTFSARTFLSPDEMKPTVWLLWQEDPQLTLAAG